MRGYTDIKCENMKTTGTYLALRDISVIFSPFEHRKLNLPTRLVMRPMARLLAQNGIPTPEMLRYYRRRAEHQLGLIVTEPVTIDDSAAAADSGMAQFCGGAALRAWKGICRAVHATPCKIAPQLCHVGMLRPASGDIPNPASPAIGPSGIDPVTREKRGETMSRERIRSVVQSFATAAAHARLLGFDAVEINGGSACLPEQFMRPETNHRTDEYGGSLESRLRFVLEILHAVRKVAGRRFPVIFRFAQYSPGWESVPLAASPAELERMLNALCEAGVDIFACDDTGVERPAFHGSAMNLAGWVRMLTHRPVITGGGVGVEYGIQGTVRRFMAHECDLVSVGRALLADAEWGSKILLAREKEITPYTERAWSRLF